MENELDNQESLEKSPKRKEPISSKASEGFGSAKAAVEAPKKPEPLAPKKPAPKPAPAPAPAPKPAPAPAPKPAAPAIARKVKTVRPIKPQGNSNRGLRQR